MKGRLPVRIAMAMSRVPRNLMTAELRRRRLRCHRKGTLTLMGLKLRTDAGGGHVQKVSVVAQRRRGGGICCWRAHCTGNHHSLCELDVSGPFTAAATRTGAAYRHSG